MGAVVHHQTQRCHWCEEYPIQGIRWKCRDCPDYDLCSSCYMRNRHDLTHGFTRIEKPGMPGKLELPRYVTLELDQNPLNSNNVVYHQKQICDGCEEWPIHGIRWKCHDCPDYDLCSNCYKLNCHDLTHGFTRIDQPGMPSTNVLPRHVTTQLAQNPLNSNNGLSYCNKLMQAGLKITFDEDCVSTCDDTTIPKAVMPCGHIMGKEAMTDYLKSATGLANHSSGDYKFKCPIPTCSRDWSYKLVSVVAQMSLEDQKEVEEKVAKNYIFYKTQNTKQCMKCQTMCYRDDLTKQCMKCPCCSKSQGSEYDFCWTCGQQWKKARDSNICGNAGCEMVDPRVQAVQNCKIKDITYGSTTIKNCPDRRACPKCGVLIEHTEACKHMNCTSCNHNFCFSCLKGIMDGKWECGNHLKHCEPAPIQTAAQIVGAT